MPGHFCSPGNETSLRDGKVGDMAWEMGNAVKPLKDPDRPWTGMDPIIRYLFCIQYFQY